MESSHTSTFSLSAQTIFCIPRVTGNTSRINFLRHFKEFKYQLGLTINGARRII